MDGGDVDAHVIRPVLAQACAGGGFVAVAQLVCDPVDQLAGEPLDPHALRRGNPPVQLRGGEGEHGAVAPDEVVHAGSLDLDDHRLASVQPRAVGLADGRGGQGLRLERLEGVVRRLAELGLGHRTNLIHRDRSHVGLEVCQLGGQRQPRRKRGAPMSPPPLRGGESTVTLVRSPFGLAHVSTVRQQGGCGCAAPFAAAVGLVLPTVVVVDAGSPAGVGPGLARTPP